MGYAWIAWAVIVAAIAITLLILTSRRRNVMNPEEDQPSEDVDRDKRREG